VLWIIHVGTYGRLHGRLARTQIRYSYVNQQESPAMTYSEELSLESEQVSLKVELLSTKRLCFWLDSPTH
jgi:hypothetical protein